MLRMDVPPCEELQVHLLSLVLSTDDLVLSTESSQKRCLYNVRHMILVSGCFQDHCSRQGDTLRLHRNGYDWITRTLSSSAVRSENAAGAAFVP